MSDGHRYCRGCRYILDGLTSTRCPECGRAFKPDVPSTYLTRLPRRRWPVWLALASGTAVLIFGVVPPAISPRGTLFPQRIIESLQSPVAVLGWSEDGLSLADGRLLVLPDIPKLPSESAALAEATRQGVEICGRRVIGLVRIHHGCGSDPVVEHVVRVDLSHILQFVGDVPSTDTAPSGWRIPPGGTFGSWGWRVGEYGQYQEWRRRCNRGP